MKLELKHIAPYLPYGLKCMYACIMDVKNDRIETMHENNIEKVLNGYGTFVILPILRPLSDLTKLKSNTDWWKIKINVGITKSLDYDSIQELLAEHYDIFGLIEQGLAININTLTK